MNDTTTPSVLKTAPFTDILMRFQWPLYAFLRGIISDQEQAHDLVQDVFCDAWRAVQRVASPFDGQGDEETIRRWLFHTAYCRAISTLRRRRLIRWDSLDALHEHEREGEAPLVTLPFEDAVLEATVLRATFAALTPESVALLLLNIVHGFSTAEIAEIVGISLDDIRRQTALSPQTEGHRLTDAQANNRLVDPLDTSAATRSQPSRRATVSRGHLAAASWWRASTAVAVVCVLVTIFALVVHSFTSTGSTPATGTWVRQYQVTAKNGSLVVAPSDPSVIYQLAKSGSLAFQRSADGGRTWTTSTVPRQKVVNDPSARLELQVSPLNANTIFATIETKESNPSNNPNCPRVGSTCTFQYVSTNGGSSWTIPDVPVKGDVGGQFWFAGSPITPPFVAQGQRLYTALVPDINEPAPEGYRLVSSTNGIHWSAADALLVSANQTVSQYVATPDGSTLFAVTVQVVTTGWTQRLLWRSDDAGAHWTDLGLFNGPATSDFAQTLLGAATVGGKAVLYIGVVDTSPAVRGGSIARFGIRADTVVGTRTYEFPPTGIPEGQGAAPGSVGILDNGALVMRVSPELVPSSKGTSPPASATFYSWRLGDQTWTPLSASLPVPPAEIKERWLTPAQPGSPATIWALTESHNEYTLWSCSVR